jgi:hypothetical protein
VTEYRQQLPEQSQNVINEQTFEEHEVSGLSGADLTRHLHDEDSADGRSDVFDDNVLSSDLMFINSSSRIGSKCVTSFDGDVGGCTVGPSVPTGIWIIFYFSYNLIIRLLF